MKEKADDYTPDEVRRGAEAVFGISLRLSEPASRRAIGQAADGLATAIRLDGAGSADPFAAADIHECDRRLDELRGERGIF